MLFKLKSEQVRVQLLIIFFFVLMAMSCKKDDIKVPAYMKIDGDSLITTAEIGADTRSFPFLTLYQNDNAQGTYEPPGTYPVIGEGVTKLSMRAHVRRLARSGFFIYSLIAPYSFQADLQPNQDFLVKPVFQYRTNTKVVWAENFNDPSLALRVRQGDFDTLVTGNDPAKRLDNTSYGLIKMKPDFSYFELESTEDFVLPKDQRDIYLELDYMCNVPFSIGLLAIDDQQAVVVISVTPFETNGVWRKGYVFLTDDVMGELQAKRFRVIIRTQTLVSFTPEIYLENLRLMHLE